MTAIEIFATQSQFNPCRARRVGNYIGTDKTGTQSPLGNTVGIYVNGVPVTRSAARHRGPAT